MNHALRWNHDRVPFDAREAARDAARREGKTLSEWLQDVIADHAGELGQPEEFLSDEERAEAVALRLEDLSGRVVAFEPRQRWSQQQRRQDAFVRDEAAFSSARGRSGRRHAPPEIAAQNRLLDRAIDILTLDPREGATTPGHEPSKPGTAPAARPDEAFRQLEQKLDSILQAVRTRPEPAPAADTPAPAPGPDRRLGQAIADVVRRQRILNLSEITPVAPRVPLTRRNGAAGQRPAVTAPLPQPVATRPPAPTPATASADVPLAKARPILTHELFALCSEIADTLRDRRAAPTDAPDAHSSTEAEAAPAPLPQIAELANEPAPPVEPLAHDRVPSAIETAALAAIDTLQRQVGELSACFERTDSDRTKLAAIDRRLAQLASDHASSVAGFEATAATAAHHAVRALMEESRLEARLATFDATAKEMTDFRQRQTATDDRTMSALDAVRMSLERVAERLISYDAQFQEMNAQEANTQESNSQEATIAPRGPVDAAPPAPAPAAERPPAMPKRDMAAERRADGARYDQDFIAQARRSTAAARKPAPDLRRPLLMVPKPVPQPSFAQQAQAYLTRHRRPIGLGLAASCVIAGVAEMASLSGLGASDTVAVAAARIAAEPTPKASETGHPAPRSGSTATTFGTDPLQTASFTKLTPQASAPFVPAVPPLSEDAAAAYVQGVSSAEGRGGPRDFARAAQAFERAADRGIVPAQVRLASLYEKGLGVARDREKAKTLYTKAAEAGNPHAMHNLAVLLTDGAGHPEYEQAAQWFRKAAQLGLRDSQFNLGVLYAEGIGVPQSLSEAYQWFAIAAAQGDDGAAKKREIVASRLSPGDLLVAKAIAASFHPRPVAPLAVAVPPPPAGVTTASLNRA